MHTDSIHLNKDQELSYFTYPSLKDLNLGAFTTAERNLVELQNIEAYCTLFKIPFPFYTKHLHQTAIVIVESREQQVNQEGDAMITQLKRFPLMICHADCQAAIFFDPLTETLALVHSGWRGSNLNIYAHVIQTMQKQFSVDPQNIVATISPSLGPDRSEFIHYKTELKEELHSYQFKPNYFDFWKLTQDQLSEAGLKSKNVTLASLCTYSTPSLCFSYRRDKNKHRDATIAWIK